MAIATYDPKNVIVTVDGTNLSGFADGTFVAVERASETFTKVVGAYGEVARVKSADRSGSMTITLMQTSNSNLFLNSLANRDEQDSTGIVAIQVKDTTTNTTINAAEAWIKTKPKAEFGKDMGNREWVFEMADLTINHGGV